MGTTPISTLAINIQDRLEENPTGPPGIFWNLQDEIYTALVEAMSDLIVLIGRPDIIASQPFTLAPNTVWQTVPKGQFLITDIVTSAGYPLWKTSLYALDYVQAGNGSGWEQDRASLPRSWAPLGFTKFIVYPAVSASNVVVDLTTIAYPTTDPWPYTGSETVPFHDEYFEALECYAAHYLRIKEGGAEYEGSLDLYRTYLSLAERLTQISDRVDPVIFSKTFGGRTGVNPITKR